LLKYFQAKKLKAKKKAATDPILSHHIKSSIFERSFDIKSSGFWDTTARRPPKAGMQLVPAFTLVTSSAYSSTLKMQTVRSG
jgi:hypothetical protein